jgi:hypothetical protein
MASLLERLNPAPGNSTGPARTSRPRPTSAPYNRQNRTPKADSDSPWSHDLYEQHNSLSARLGNVDSSGSASRTALNPYQKAVRDAVGNSGQLSIKGAGALNANVVKIEGLSPGTTAEDVQAIFKACGAIVSAKVVPASAKGVTVQIQFKEAKAATEAISKFHGQAADGGLLSVTLVGARSSGVTLGSRLGAHDGLDLVRDEGSVDVLMQSNNGDSKMRSDSLLKTDPRAQVLIAPPGANPADYTQSTRGRGGRRGGPGGRGPGRRRGRGARMDLD